MSLTRDEYAVYLPAVNDSYAAEVVKPLNTARPFPNGLALQDLVFWEPNQLWHYPYLLHSIGLYGVGDLPNNAVTQRTRGSNMLLGDSGGYQIGSGTLKGLKSLGSKPMKAQDAVLAWQQASHVRDWIFGWLETHADYAMTVDMPLWATAPVGAKSPFHNCSTKQLIDMTVDNLKFIERRLSGRAKWLNVVQGGPSEDDILLWWNAVKWFRHGGWAMAGRAGVAGGLFHMLSTLLTMRDEGAFEAGQDWIHVLGVSTPKWAVLLTAIQRALRRINPTLKISFDSSSPFQTGGRYEDASITPVFTCNEQDWVIGTQRAPQSGLHTTDDNTLAFPKSKGPLAQKLALGHLSVRGGMWDHRPYDSVSNTLLVNHNVWVYLDAMLTANDLAAANDVARVPKAYLDCIAFIGDVFSCTSWQAAMAGNRTLLDQVGPNGYEMV